MTESVTVHGMSEILPETDLPGKQNPHERKYFL
jgi:hypothetical protein